MGIWALGCILYELVTLRPAFSGDSIPRLVMRIVRDPLPVLPDTCLALVRTVCDCLLVRDPKLRSSLSEIILKLRKVEFQSVLEQVLEEVGKLDRSSPSDLEKLATDHPFSKVICLVNT